MRKSSTHRGSTYVVHLGDQRRRRTDSQGIITFSVGITRALPSALHDDERLVVLVNDELREELGSDWGRDGDRLEVIAAPRSVAARLRVDHVVLPALARRSGADAVLCPKGFLPLRTPRATEFAVCLHDDIPFRQLSDGALTLRRRARALYFSLLLWRSLRAADRRLFVSESTRSALARHSARRLDDLVIGEGISLPRRALRPVAVRRRQAVVFGSPHPHKRIDAGIDLLSSSEGIARQLDRIIVVSSHAPRPRTPGPLSIEHRHDVLDADEVADLVAESRLVLFPSEYEGFGLPPIEAYALGTPAVHRRSLVARELIPGAPGGYDHESSDVFDAAVAEAIALDDDDLASLSDQMWRRFDWATVARDVAGALRATPPGHQA